MLGRSSIENKILALVSGEDSDDVTVNAIEIGADEEDSLTWEE